MEKQTFEFQVKQSLTLGNSFGTIKQEDNVELNITIGINSEEYGWFELYDLESGGEDWYAEGGLWFENKKVTDYDGVYSLSDKIIEKLEELGYDCEEIK